MRVLILGTVAGVVFVVLRSLVAMYDVKMLDRPCEMFVPRGDECDSIGCHQSFAKQ